MERQAALSVTPRGGRKLEVDTLANRIVAVALERALTSTAVPDNDTIRDSAPPPIEDIPTTLTSSTTPSTTTSIKSTTITTSTTTRKASTTTTSTKRPTTRKPNPTTSRSRGTPMVTRTTPKSTPRTTRRTTTTTPRPTSTAATTESLVENVPFAVNLDVPEVPEKAADLQAFPEANKHNTNRLSLWLVPANDKSNAEPLENDDGPSNLDIEQTTSIPITTITARTTSRKKPAPKRPANSAEADAALLAAVLNAASNNNINNKETGAEDPSFRDQLLLAELLRPVSSTTKRPKKKSSSTPPPQDIRSILFPPIRQSPSEEDSRDQPLVTAAINVTRAVSQFMGLVIQNAAQSFQQFVQQRTGGLARLLSNWGTTGSRPV